MMDRTHGLVFPISLVVAWQAGIQVERCTVIVVQQQLYERIAGLTLHRIEVGMKRRKIFAGMQILKPGDVAVIATIGNHLQHRVVAQEAARVTVRQPFVAQPSLGLASAIHGPHDSRIQMFYCCFLRASSRCG